MRQRTLKTLPKATKPQPLTERRFLGIVSDRSTETATIAPLYGWTAAKEKWDELSSPKPTRWVGANARATKGSLWAFNVEYLPGFDDGTDEPEIEGYLIPQGTEKAPTYLTEILFEKPIEREPRRSRPSGIVSGEFGVNRALTNAERIVDEYFLDLESIRKRYFVDGLMLQFQPQSTVYIVVRDCFTLGPFSFASDESGLWRAKANGDISVFQHLRTSAYQAVHIDDNRRYFVTPHSIPPQQVALADFGDDAEVLTDFLVVLNERTPAIPEGDLIRRIGEHTRVDESNQVFMYQRLRLQDAAASVLASDRLRGDAEREILKIPSIAALVEQNIETARTEIKQRVNNELANARAEIEAELSARQDKVDELRRTETAVSAAIGERQSEIERLNAKCDETRIELSRLQSELTPAIDDRISRIAATVSERLIASTFVTILDARSLQNRPHHNVESVPVTPVYPFENVSASRRLEDAADTVRCLRKTCQVAGIKHEAAIVILASLIENRIPVVMGPAADNLLWVVGQVLFSGRVVNRTVSQLFADFSDLFGRLSVTSKTFCPDADGLADLLVTATPDCPCLVVFDGFNRCEEGVFSPLLLERHTEERKRLPILPPGFLSDDDPYVRLSAINWPVAAFPVLRYAPEGQPPSVRLWSRTAAVYCEFDEAVGDAIGSMSELPLATHSEIFEASKGRYLEAEEIISSHFSTEARSASAEAFVQGSSLSRLCSVLLACGLSSEVAVAFALDALVVMPLLSYHGATPGVVSKRCALYERILGIA